jgi:monofunctional biosynthetic peptidoglycan transglycosylase
VKRAVRWIGFAFAALAAACLIYEGWFLGHIVWWKNFAPARTSFMEARLETMRKIEPRAALQYQWLDYARISPHLKRAVIAAEDAKFIDHDGFDWEGIQRAMEKNQRRGKVVAGGSTISQQLAKNLFLSGERSLARKAQETLVTLMLEAVLEKRRILELYLNVAEWGEGIFGCEAAARHYFGVSAAGLSAAQAARLAAMLPRPRFYDRNRNSAYLAAYAARILARMPSSQTP